MELTIARKCYLLSKNKNISQAEIARRIGISRISVNRFFNGKSELRISDFISMMKVLGYDVERQVNDLLLHSLPIDPVTILNPETNGAAL
jgi:transcriptional regulator with XRE-family HTH domain